MDTFFKDPDATLDWSWDWSSWLATGETISTATVDTPVGLTGNSTSNGDTTVTVWLSGGTVGDSHTVTCRVTTSQGRTDDRSIRLRIGDR